VRLSTDPVSVVVLTTFFSSLLGFRIEPVRFLYRTLVVEA
jgi:hypothetical protein